MTQPHGTETSTSARTGSKDVARQLKKYIVDNQLRPGDSLPTEPDLAELWGASRSSVREAIKTLSALDIVEVRHGSGTFVGRMSLEPMVETLAFRGILAQTKDRHVLAELVDVREMIEVAMVDQVINDLPPTAMLTLRRLTATMLEKAALGEDLLVEDREFHLLLASSSGIEFFRALMGAFWDVHDIASKTLGKTRDLQTTAQAHVKILDAIASKDREATREAIREHYGPLRIRMEQELHPDGVGLRL